MSTEKYNFDPNTGVPIIENDFIDEKIATDTPLDIVKFKLNEETARENTAVTMAAISFLTIIISLAAAIICFIASDGVLFGSIVTLCLFVFDAIYLCFKKSSTLKKVIERTKGKECEYRFYKSFFIYIEKEADGRICRILAHKLCDVKKHAPRKLSRTFIADNLIFILPKSAFRFGSRFAEFIDGLYPSKQNSTNQTSNNDYSIPVNIPTSPRIPASLIVIIILCAISFLGFIASICINSILEYKLYFISFFIAVLPAAALVVYGIRLRKDNLKPVFIGIPLFLFLFLFSQATTFKMNHTDLVDTKICLEKLSSISETIDMPFPESDDSFSYTDVVYDRHLDTEEEYIEYCFYYEGKDAATMRTLSEGELWLSTLEGDMKLYFSDYIYGDCRILVYNKTEASFNTTSTDKVCEYLLLTYNEYDCLGIIELTK